MLNDKGFIVAKSQRHIDKMASSIARTLKPIEYFTQAEFEALPMGSEFYFDTECYPNFWYCAFRCAKSGKIIDFELSPDRALNVGMLTWMFWRFCVIGFNSIAYDKPMLTLALSGATNAELKEASDYLIIPKLDDFNRPIKVTPFMFEKKYKVKIQQTNHIDMFNVAPLQGSLKLYGGRLHCERMQDLPFDPMHVLTKEDAEVLRPYCCNDLDINRLLYEELKPEFDLRVEMSKEYEVDLRSKSDAQIAEAVINSELAKLLGYYPVKPTLAEGTTLKYAVPDYMQFRTQEMKDVIELIRMAEFHLDGGGKPLWPEGLGELNEKKEWELKVTVGSNTYKLGMGGFHSMEKSIAHFFGPDTILADIDVESFYPRTILNQRLFPAHLTEAFLVVYEKIVSTRIHAKHMSAECKKKGDKDGAKRWKKIADSLKIVINGSFGKLGSKFSTLYAPQLMLQVTITGQLVLLMLIEMLEAAGIPVVSGNTDGLITKYPKALYETKWSIVKQWEALTAYKMEETRYAATYSRDVNNYLATKLKFENGAWTDEIEEIKVKGVYAERGSALNSVLSKNPESLIVSDAMQALIMKGTPVAKTVTECQDIRRFVSIKNVTKGGGEKNGVYLGKVVRWYYPKNEGGYIAYVGSGNKVAKTDNARPLMDLPDELPKDIDYEYYIKEANDALYEVGFYKKATTEALFF